MAPKVVIQSAAVIALVASITSGVVAVENRFASKKAVAVVAQQIALMKISAAKAARNKALLANLCSDFERTYRWRPSQCRS
jgi:hypothetical protein